MITPRSLWRGWPAALVLALALPGRASAQAPAMGTGPRDGALVGTVVDSAGGAPIVAARVRVLEAHREDVTHDAGEFAVARVPAGTYTVVVQRIGYRPATRRVAVAGGERVELRVALAPAAVQLAPQVVTGTLTERSADESISPTSVVAGAELDRRVETTIAATLQGQPGVSVTSIGPATGRPVIRGLSGDRILVLEDGLRPGDLSSTSGDHAVSVDPLTARQIEVVRGPNSLLYGSSALGGVVNVVRDEVPTALPDRAHGVVSAQGSSVNDGATVGAYATRGVGPVALRVEGSGRTAADVRTPVGRLNNTDARTYGASAGAALVGDWGHAGASYRFYDNAYGIPGGFVGGHPRGVNIEMRRHTVRGEAERHFREGAALSTVRATAQFSDYRHVEYEQSGAVGTRFGQDFAAADLLARHGALGPFSLGAAGARVQYRDVVTGGSLRTPSTEDVNVAGYVVEEAGRGRLRAQAGARYDWARFTPREDAVVVVGGEAVPVRPRTFGAVSGSLGALYELRPGVRLGASVSRAYRTPDFNELYSNGPHLAANTYDVGDPRLDEETGVGADAFARVTGDRGRLELAAFRNALANYITPASRGRVEIGTQGGVAQLQYTNADAVLAGFEADGELAVTRAVVAEGTLSYVRGRFTSALDPVPVFTTTPTGVDTSFVAASRAPPLLPPLNGRVGVRLERPRYFAGAGARLAARQERLGDFETPTAGYGLVDLTGGYRLLAGGRLHSFTLRVENLLDKEYRDHLSRTKAIMPEPGRNVSLVYRLAF